MRMWTGNEIPEGEHEEGDDDDAEEERHHSGWCSGEEMRCEVESSQPRHYGRLVPIIVF